MGLGMTLEGPDVFMRFHNDVMTALLALCERNPPATGGFPSQRVSTAEHFYCFCCKLELVVEQTVKLSVIWDMALESYHCLMWMDHTDSVFQQYHYSDVIMSAMASQISGVFTQSFVRAQIKENIKALRHWPLTGEFTGDRWIPRTKGP